MTDIHFSVATVNMCQRDFISVVSAQLPKVGQTLQESVQ